MSRPEKESARQRRAAGGVAGSRRAGRAAGAVLEDHGARGRAAGGREAKLAAAGLLGVLACLPSEDISSYSSSYRRSEPELVLEDSVSAGSEQPGASVAAPQPPALPGEAAPGAAPLAGECNGDCLAQDLPLLIDAGSASPAEGSVGSVAPNDVPVSEGDAGVAPAPVDAALPGPCGQGALLASDDRCFALVTAPSTWANARDACEERGPGWDLAVIRDEERNSLLAGMLAGVLDAWVGANDLAQEGSWRWLGDTNPFFTGTGTAGSATAGAYVNWNTGGTPEPNGGAASDCLRLRATGGWADIACTSTFAALCEGPQP